LGYYGLWKLVMKNATSRNDSKYSLVHTLHQQNING